MKVCVYGPTHLGLVTAACIAAEGIETVLLGTDAALIAEIAAGRLPIFEPGLEELTAAGRMSGTLSATADAASALSNAELIWIAFDTPVDANDVADVDFLLDKVRALFPHLASGQVVLISSQVPVGSTRGLQREFALARPGIAVHFGYSPENLRLGTAIDVFTNAERIVVGVDGAEPKAVLDPLLSRFTETIVWMRVESAEMTKHALNAFLATSVTFANELATICEEVDADMGEVEAALRLEPRIGTKAYIRPGTAFGGGTLARDVRFLNAIAAGHGARLPLLSAILESNDLHKGWTLRRLRDRLGGLAGKRIGVLGLAYKPGTDSIRRSLALELISALISESARVVAFDPKVARLDAAPGPEIASSAAGVFTGADAVVLATEWPEFRDLDYASATGSMTRPVVVDQNNFLAGRLPATAEHLVGGRPA